MKLYFGTTSNDAVRIETQGLIPPATTGEVWFSRSVPIARARARQLCRRKGGEPLVAVCRVDVAGALKRQGKIRCRGPMVAVQGEIGPDQVCEFLPVSEASDPQTALEAVLTEGEVFGLLDSASPRLRMMGVMMLSGQESPMAFDWLCTRLEDPDPRVRLAVAMALRRRGREAADVLKGMGLDRDPMVRRAARAEIEPDELAMV